VPDERVVFYKWLAAATLGRRNCTVRSEDFYVAPEEMERAPNIVQRLHHEIPDSGDQRSAIIIDISLNSFHLISDEFLWNIGDITHRWLDSRPKQHVVILLPGVGLPGRASLFWNKLSRDTPDRFSGRLTIIVNDGTIWPDNPRQRPTKEEYAKKNSRDREWLKDQLESRIIRRLGHYRFDGRDGDHCARYFFDARHAVHEVGELIVDWVRTSLQSGPLAGKPMTLLSHGKRSDWFHDAVAGAAARLGTEFVSVSDDGTLPDADGLNLSGAVVPVFNIVHSGETFAHVVEWLTAAGVQVSPLALTVIVSDDNVRSEANGTRLNWLSGPQIRDRKPRSECVQCQLELPFTPTDEEPTVGIRAIDMWTMFQEVEWREETFGAEPGHLYKSLPDMGELFKQHGNWIAYKVHQLLLMLGAHEEVAFICPDESHIAVLVEHLGILLQNRQVTVRVPRNIIKPRTRRTETAKQRDGRWRRQLEHLAKQHFRQILIIDETAGSKATANALVRILREFELQPLAFVPIIDFSPDIRIPGVQTYPLYILPNHRGTG
jgi:hypothetical protein